MFIESNFYCLCSVLSWKAVLLNAQPDKQQQKNEWDNSYSHQSGLFDPTIKMARYDDDDDDMNDVHVYMMQHCMYVCMYVYVKIPYLFHAVPSTFINSSSLYFTPTGFLLPLLLLTLRFPHVHDRTIYIGTLLSRKPP